MHCGVVFRTAVFSCWLLSHLIQFLLNVFKCCLAECQTGMKRENRRKKINKYLKFLSIDTAQQNQLNKESYEYTPVLGTKEYWLKGECKMCNIRNKKRDCPDFHKIDSAPSNSLFRSDTQDSTSICLFHTPPLSPHHASSPCYPQRGTILQL